MLCFKDLAISFGNWYILVLDILYCIKLEIVFLIVKEGILRVHPDLAGRIAEAGQLTLESTKEQSQAQLNTMTKEEKKIMIELNARYKEKFGFPFVICARLNKKEAIFKGLEERYNHDLKRELETGIDQVMRICEFRVKDIVMSSNSKL